MEHKLTPSGTDNSISVIQFNNKVILIKITDNGIETPIALSKSELHSFIGTLLHVQSKMK